jgi:hypothetical protein
MIHTVPQVAHVADNVSPPVPWSVAVVCMHLGQRGPVYCGPVEFSRVWGV